ncbi:MAG: cysteine desulfurase [Flavobacteriia bacterium]|nr:cysteine desulfurase [Flavobacteriia bacterium]OIP45851.1 MAG: cysteine desulfurase [Flavobacteriaceae bacterium CG2_30_31_66]PIV97754.1 MAG: cysteine desulfurase [Flavobacteriaceae bacterium CG17_big_fil_post_rev_8_21_14_2_50_31_13]PIY15147.1 MAG: cysteine desulfurase [Flavobacteriaceae bacterium CG_4_10_14_3_um_filter_31_253]PIZ09473.1 MAG: cysteine desulfurase [Flavobacteriaceae bacterium CG_4_10_14_0_8_um_filter_31_99]PJC10032.1 MAG: cysteine desulfurase [Flavobacteriaceae bacterium CG_
MKPIYLDNAATTMIDAEVLSVIQAASLENYGNPSSTHQFGRKAKSAIETARKNIAKYFNVSAGEIIFTSGGTEADNLILNNAVLNLGVQRIITSKIEHHAVLHTCEFLEKTSHRVVDFVKLDAFGAVDLEHLETLLATSDKKTLISLMFINNEIGNILQVAEICELSKKYKALFHSDTVQVIGHYTIDLQQFPIDFIVASAHKFHGPKGVGFAYFKKGFGILPLFYGGNQEKGARSSTENVQGILGMEKALEIAQKNIAIDATSLKNIKRYFISELNNSFQNIHFNGLSEDLEKSSYTILNVRFPVKNDLLLFSLDMAGIAVSGGSACQSGGNKGSHVLQEILDDAAVKMTSIRFSFSKFTTKEDIDFTIVKLKQLLQ